MIISSSRSSSHPSSHPSSPSSSLQQDILSDIEKAHDFLKKHNYMKNNVFLENDKNPNFAFDLPQDLEDSESSQRNKKKKVESDEKVGIKNKRKSFKKFNFICSVHRNKIISLCLQHSRFLCDECVEEHENHLSRVTPFDNENLIESISNLKEKLNEYSARITNLQSDFKTIINKEVKKSDRILEIFKNAFGFLSYSFMEPIQIKIKRGRTFFKSGFSKQSSFNLDNEDELFINNLFPGKKILAKLIFRASKHNFLSVSFHNKCDHKGPTITIVKSEGGMLFGGYTSVSWKTKRKGKYLSDSNSFLFSLTYHTKHRLFPSETKSIFCCDNLGPTFGKGFDLCIRNRCNDVSNNYCKLGASYKSWEEEGRDVKGKEYEERGREDGGKKKDEGERRRGEEGKKKVVGGNREEKDDNSNEEMEKEEKEVEEEEEEKEMEEEGKEGERKDGRREKGGEMLMAGEEKFRVDDYEVFAVKIVEEEE